MPLELTWPLYKFSNITFTPIHYNRVAGASAFSPVTKVIAATSVVWKAEINLPVLEHDDARDLDGFLASLRGGYNRVLLYDNVRKMRGKGATSTCNINVAASPAAESITLNNLLPNQSAAFGIGDMLGIGGNPYMTTNKAPSDASGRSTITIVPSLRKGVAAGDVVEVIDPTGRFILREGFESTYIPPDFAGGNKLTFSEDPYVV